MKKAPIPLTELQEETARKRRKMSSLERRRHDRDSVKRKEEIVRGLGSGALAGVAPKKAEQRREADLMAYEYAKKVTKYRKVLRVYDWQKRLQQNAGQVGCMSRAVAQAEILGASYNDYLEAQFYWFDDWYSRPPRYPEIASAGAIVRYRKWKVLRDTGVAPKCTVHPATVIVKVEAKKELPEAVLRYEQKVLSRMVRQWGSEEEVWRLFGSPGNCEVFSDSFKETRQCWRDIYGGKETKKN